MREDISQKQTMHGLEETRIHFRKCCPFGSAAGRNKVCVCVYTNTTPYR